MSCRFTEIDELDVSPAEKNRLTGIKLDLTKTIKEHGGSDPTFTVTDGYLRINKKYGRAEQLQLLTGLNSQYGGTPERPVVFDKELTYRGSPISVVGIDVRPLVNPNYGAIDLGTSDDDRLFTAVGISALDQVAQTDLARNLKSFALDGSTTGNQDFLLESHKKLFTGMVNGLREKLRKYIALIDEGKIQKPLADVTRESLWEQYQTLNDKDALTTLESLSAYVVESTNWLDALYKNTVEGESSLRQKQKQLDNNLTPDGNPLSTAERESLLTEVATDLQKAKHYLYLFNGLQELNQGLASHGFVIKSDKTVERGPGFTTDLNSWLDEQGFTPGRKDVVNTFLQNPLFTMQGLRTLLARQLEDIHQTQYGSEFNERIDSLFKHLTESYPSRSTETILQEALAKAAKLKEVLKDTHYVLIKNWLWPKIQEKQADYTGSFKLTEDDIIPLLKAASEDEGIFTYGLDAPIQSSDPILAVTANLVSDSLYEAVGLTRQDVTELSEIRDGLGLEKTMTEAQIRDYHAEMTQDVILELTGGEGGIADSDWQGPVLTIVDLAGNPLKLKGYTKRGFVTEFNTSLFDSQRRYVFKQLDTSVAQLTEGLNVDENGLIQPIAGQPHPARLVLDRLASQQKEGSIYTAVYNDLTKKTGNAVLFKQFNETAPISLTDLQTELKKGVLRNFSKLHTTPLSAEKKDELFIATGLMTEKDVYPALQSTLPDFIKKGVKSRVLTEQEKKRPDLLVKGLTDNPATFTRFDETLDTMMIYAEVNSEKGARYGWVPLTAKSIESVKTIYYSYKHLQNPASFYKVRAWDELQRNPEKYLYYSALYSAYEQANYKLGDVGLKHGILPQVEQLQNVAVGEAGWFSRLWDWIKQHTFLKTIRDSYEWLTGTATDTASGQTPNYLNNDPVKTVPARFITPIPDSQLEGDLFRSVLMYKTGANTYEQLRKLDPLIHAVKTLTHGDSLLGIDERLANNVSWIDSKLGQLQKQPKKTRASRLNKKMGDFLNDIIYGETQFDDVYKLGNKPVDMHKVSQALSGFTAFSSLAWNISSMGANIGVGFLSNYSEGIKGKYYTAPDWRWAQKEYWNQLTQNGSVYKDLTTSSPNQKGLLAQLLLRFDGIQGELIDENGDISRTGSTEKLYARALFWTQSGAEHWIQSTSMLAQLKGYKLPDGRSLWDTVQFTPGQPVSFDNVSEKELRNFQQQLHSVNKQLHGHYAKFDKALIQRHWAGAMAMMFKKYIYSSLRYRFGGDRFDWEAGDETVGHLRAYWEQLHTELKAQKGIWTKAAILGNGLIVKPTVGALDQLSGGKLATLGNVGNYLYGDESGGRNAAVRQTGFDVLWYLAMTMLAAMIHGLDDEDDPNGPVAQNLEILARRMEGDLGMYLFGYGGTGLRTAFTTYDKAWQLVKSPMAQLRAYDGSVSLIAQLSTDLGNLATGDDIERYKRDGPGYERGQSKLQRKVENSLLGPLHQLWRVTSPEQQLQYFNLSRRNSQ